MDIPNNHKYYLMYCVSVCSISKFSVYIESNMNNKLESTRVSLLSCNSVINHLSNGRYKHAI